MDSLQCNNSAFFSFVFALAALIIFLRGVFCLNEIVRCAKRGRGAQTNCLPSFSACKSSSSFRSVVLNKTHAKNMQRRPTHAPLFSCEKSHFSRLVAAHKSKKGASFTCNFRIPKIECSFAIPHSNFQLDPFRIRIFLSNL